MIDRLERSLSRYLLIHGLSRARWILAKTLELLELSTEASRPQASIICSTGHTLSVVIWEIISM
jgi:hypothetical protein